MAKATNDNTIRTHGNGRRPPTDAARLRAKMVVAVERLLTALDALDAAAEDKEEDDPGEEGGDDELSLGWSGGTHGGPVLLGGADEREDDDPAEDAGDSEPSLGSFDRMLNQTKSWWQHGWTAEDAELDDCDREDDELGDDVLERGELDEGRS